MAEVANDDLVEQILMRSDVKTALRFKRVCKSWHSLIKSPRFINLHLNHSYNKDRYNNEFDHRRICLVNGYSFHLVGSSNGLVCVINPHIVLVGNPLTREVREPITLNGSPSLCWGFGHDSSTDDYMVIIGTAKGKDRRCVQLQGFSLKANVWRDIGDVECAFIDKAGVLCNGSLHWLVRDNENTEKRIICYNLAKEELKEILLPNEARYEVTSFSYLGVMEECLCVYCQEVPSDYVWMIKTYNAKQSWEMVRRNPPMKYDIVHYLKKPDNPFDERFFHLAEILRTRDLGYIYVPIFVQSLVSPHVNGRPTRDKRSA